MSIIKVKYFDEACKIAQVNNSDWIDLRSAIDYCGYSGEYKLIPLGVAMQFPKGYEAHVIPRSSSFKNYGFVQTNSMGLIDESYCGDNDQWFLPAYFLKAGVIAKGDRIAQFRIVRKMDHIEILEVSELCNKDRGGYGSSGKK